MKVRTNVGGKIIKRVLVYSGIYHCVVQDFYGHIHHAKFDDKRAALKYMTRFQSDAIKLEYL